MNQTALCCPCGKTPIVAKGCCATCYTLKRRDDAEHGGLRDAVLTRDERRCRVCGLPGEGKRKIALFHRKPGSSTLQDMISVCPSCLATVTRTKHQKPWWSELLVILWCEYNSLKVHQRSIDFNERPTAPETLTMFY
jgi:5-methylcytosine-specific restriction endonuclease McrA